MRRGTHPVAWLAVLLLAFAAQGAWAHGIARHHSPAGVAATDASVPGASITSPRLTPPCPDPGSPVHACGCGNLSLCEPSTKLACLQAPASRLLAAPALSEAPPRAAPWHRSRAPELAAHRPRAPPSLA